MFRHSVCTLMRSAQSYNHYVHIRALLSRSSGKMKFDSSSWYVKAGLLRFCGDHVRVLFLQTTHFVPWLQRPVLKIPKMKQTVLTVDIKSSFSSALSASFAANHHYR